MNKFLFFFILNVSSAFSQNAVIPIEELRNKLKLTQLEIKGANAFQAAKISGITIQLPMPDGSQSSYYVLENQVMSPELAKQYPDIKTYQIFNINNNSNETGTLTLSPYGLNGYLFTEKGNVIISPKDYKINLHQVIFEKDNPIVDETCGVKDEIHKIPDLNKKKGKENATNTYSNGGTLRTYKMVIASNGEFYAANGSTAIAVQAAIVSIVNSLKSIYEKEVAISFTLFATKIYDNAGTDPFDPSANNKADQAANVFGALAIAEPGSFALNLWNIGHVLHGASGGGVAYTPSTCNDYVQTPMTGPLKGGGWSGSNPTSFSTFIHEVGHQFSAGHTFNSVSSGCNGNIMTGSAFEPGSGSTFMSYWGNCSPDNISGPINRVHFNTNSLQSIINFSTTSGTCSTNTSTGNAVPVANAGAAYTIPKNTPFILTGSGTDANGDILYYNWEQYNLGTTRGSAATAAGSTDSPIFRSFEPTTTGNIRSFPALANVLSGSIPTNDEALPTVGRSLLFRLTARDNKVGGGGTHCAAATITVDGNSGPFKFSSFNAPTVWVYNGTNSVNVTWDVANTSVAPINCTNVKILFSTDGGQTFPITLLASTPNDGSQILTIPNNITSTGRVKIESIGNIFFDINDKNITISNGCIAEASSIITPSTAFTETLGSPNLNLTSTPLFASINGFSSTINASDLTTNLTVFNATNSSCGSFGNAPQFETLIFQVDVSGTYTIGFLGGTLPSQIMNFYQNAFINGSNCTNWLKSNATYNGSTVSAGLSITHTLTAGTVYVLMISGFNNGDAGTYTLSVTPPSGGSARFNAPQINEFSYLIQNTSNNLITDIKSNTNLTALAAGTYRIYVFSYSSNTNNSSLINTNFTTLQTNLNNGSVCGKLSDNFRQITINGPCPATLNFTNPANNISTGTIVQKANQTITATNSITGGDVTFQAGNTIELNPGFQVSNGAVFRSILVAGCI